MCTHLERNHAHLIQEAKIMRFCPSTAILQLNDSELLHFLHHLVIYLWVAMKKSAAARSATKN